jgi:hypothetical protein
MVICGALVKRWSSLTRLAGWLSLARSNPRLHRKAKRMRAVQ